MKQEIINKWGKPEESFWNVGGSSPWLKKYEITNTKKLDNDSYEFTIKYYWTSSAGDSEPTQITLVVTKEKDKWCVKETM